MVKMIDTTNIDYTALIDEAMHIIVKKSLQIALKGKLPGEHHFFISFITTYPGVILSNKLKHKYPKEMTIVLQHQFEELEVDNLKFSVVLSFDNIREKIVIPFVALTAFADPSVKFGLQFKHIEEVYNDDNKNSNHQIKILDNEVTNESDHKNSTTSKSKIKKDFKNVVEFEEFRNKFRKK